MQLSVFFVIFNTLFVVNHAQRWVQNNQISSNFVNNVERANAEVDFHFGGPSLSTGVVLTKPQVPYVEVLKLVQSFLKLKGEMAGRLWALLNDNGHILSALRDTLITKISSIHNFTLTAIVILRKILEFANSLFSNVNVNAGFAFG